MRTIREKRIRLLVLTSPACLITGQDFADVYVYPEKGQSQQQETDKYQRYTWAVQQTGFDPLKQPTATAPPLPQVAPQGGLFRGAAVGAAGGAIGGAIAGDAGKGAAIGAAVGGLIGGLRGQAEPGRGRLAPTTPRSAAAATGQCVAAGLFGLFVGPRLRRSIRSTDKIRIAFRSEAQSVSTR